MIGQITPLVQAAGRRVWMAAASAHLVGATLAASIFGLLLGTLGLALGLPQWGSQIGMLGGAVLLICALRDCGAWPWSLPPMHRQTPAWFRAAFGPQWSAFAWGADLGLGWTTYVTFSGYYALVLWALLLSDPVQGGMIVGAYGLGRALPVMGAGLACHRDLGLAHLSRLRFLKVVNAAALTFVACYFLVGWMMQWFYS